MAVTRNDTVRLSFYCAYKKLIVRGICFHNWKVRQVCSNKLYFPSNVG